MELDLIVLTHDLPFKLVQYINFLLASSSLVEYSIMLSSFVFVILGSGSSKSIQCDVNILCSFVSFSTFHSDNCQIWSCSCRANSVHEPRWINFAREKFRPPSGAPCYVKEEKDLVAS